MNSAFLIIDPQKGFNHQATHSAFMNALDLSNHFENTIIARFEHEDDSSFVKHLSWKRMLKDQTDTDLIPEYKTLKANMVTHKTYTVLNAELISALNNIASSKLFIAGVFTDVCVVKTAMDAFDQGYEPYVVIDCCATLHGQDVHIATLKSLQHIIGQKRLVSSTQIKASLEK